MMSGDDTTSFFSVLQLLKTAVGGKWEGLARGRRTCRRHKQDEASIDILARLTGFKRNKISSCSVALYLQVHETPNPFHFAFKWRVQDAANPISIFRLRNPVYGVYEFTKKETSAHLTCIQYSARRNFLCSLVWCNHCVICKWRQHGIQKRGKTSFCWAHDEAVGRSQRYGSYPS